MTEETYKAIYESKDGLSNLKALRLANELIENNLKRETVYENSQDRIDVFEDEDGKYIIAYIFISDSKFYVLGFPNSTGATIHLMDTLISIIENSVFETHMPSRDILIPKLAAYVYRELRSLAKKGPEVTRNEMSKINSHFEKIGRGKGYGSYILSAYIGVIVLLLNSSETDRKILEEIRAQA